MFAGWLVVAAAHAGGLTIDDPTGCVDSDGVERALAGVEGAERVELAISVLPEGERRGLHLVWAQLHERDIEVVASDCAQVPDLVALATKRVLASLPSRLTAKQAPIVTSLGTGLGAGVDRWAPRGTLWADWVSRDPIALAFGIYGAVGNQPLPTGSAWTTVASGRVGGAGRVGRARMDLAVAGEAMVGRGAGLTENRTSWLVRPVVRTGVSSDTRLRVGGFVEVPVIRTLWSVEGGEQVPEPLVRAQLELGWIVGSR